MTDAPVTATAAAAGETRSAPAPALRLLGATGAVCVDGVCSVEPTIDADQR